MLHNIFFIIPLLRNMNLINQNLNFTVMKKISMFFMATAMMAFVACGGGEKKSGDATSETAEAVVEEAAAPSSSSSSSDVVAQYQALCDKMVELAPKMKSGDMDAVQEYQKIAEEFANFAQQNADAWNNLSAEDIAKIQEIGQKAAAAMQ